MENYDEIRNIDEEACINAAFQELLDIYLASQHRKKVGLITKAFNFARQAHKGVRRHSGEPYIMHPLAVAHIVCKEIGLGSTSICAALLHDVVEDTDYTIEDIRNLFGEKISGIVDGMKNGKLTVTTDSGFTFRVNCDLTARQQAILLAGGLLNYTKEGGV